MISIQVKAAREPQALAELIEATQAGGAVVRDPNFAVEATIVREHQEQAERQRPSWQTLDTVDFQKIDDDNDWSDV